MTRLRKAAVVLLASFGLSTSGYAIASHITAGATTSRTAIASTIRSTSDSATVLFDDEFDGNSLDLSKWRPNWLGPNDSAITKPINGAEASCYDPAQANVPGDGYLHLSAAHRSCRASNGRTYAYASGLVQSFGHFTFTDGYLEARVWLPGTSTISNWPAVWTDGTGQWPQTGESDVMEGLSGKACYHYHSPSGGPGGCPSGSFTGWHTYAEEVTNGVTTYYYDGTRVGALPNVAAPHYIVLNLGVGGWGGAISAPSEMLVDYVRVTRHKGDAVVGNPVDPTRGTKGAGYLTVDAAGGVRAYGHVGMRGDLSGHRLSAPIVAAARTPNGMGYWLVASDGGVFAFGNAKFHGSMANHRLSAPIVAFAASRSGRGYYLVGADGGIFSFGDARFRGSTGAMHLRAPIRDLALSPSGKGYWLVARDGGVFSFGDARFHGSTGSVRLSAPIESITAGRKGYWLVAQDGGIFAFGVAYHGSLPSIGAGVRDARRIRALNDGSGYYILTGHGGLYTFGTARYFGAAAMRSAVDLVLAPS